MARIKGSEKRKRREENEEEEEGQSKRKRIDSGSYVLEVLFNRNLSQFNLFEEMNSGRKVIPGKAVDFSLFGDEEKGWTLPSITHLVNQGWKRFLKIKEPTFTRLIQVLITNLNPSSRKSWIGECEIDLSSSSLREIFDIPEVQEFQDYPSKGEIFSELGNGSFTDSTKYLPTKVLSFDLKVAHTILVHCVCPRIGSLDQVPIKEARTLWALMKGHKLDLAKIISDQLVYAKNYPRSPIPYGMFLTKVLKHFQINLKDEPNIPFRKSEVISKSTIKRMGYIFTSQGWVSKRKGITEVTQAEDDQVHISKQPEQRPEEEARTDAEEEEIREETLEAVAEIAKEVAEEATREEEGEEAERRTEVREIIEEVVEIARKVVMEQIAEEMEDEEEEMREAALGMLGIREEEEFSLPRDAESPAASPAPSTQPQPAPQTVYNLADLQHFLTKSLTDLETRLTLRIDNLEQSLNTKIETIHSLLQTHQIPHKSPSPPPQSPQPVTPIPSPQPTSPTPLSPQQTTSPVPQPAQSPSPTQPSPPPELPTQQPDSQPIPSPQQTPEITQKLPESKTPTSFTLRKQSAHEPDTSIIHLESDIYYEMIEANAHAINQKEELPYPEMADPAILARIRTIPSKSKPPKHTKPSSSRPSSSRITKSRTTKTPAKPRQPRQSPKPRAPRQPKQPPKPRPRAKPTVAIIPPTATPSTIPTAAPLLSVGHLPPPKVPTLASTSTLQQQPQISDPNRIYMEDEEYISKMNANNDALQRCTLQIQRTGIYATPNYPFPELKDPTYRSKLVLKPTIHAVQPISTRPPSPPPHTLPPTQSFLPPRPLPPSRPIPPPPKPKPVLSLTYKKKSVHKSSSSSNPPPS